MSNYNKKNTFWIIIYIALQIVGCMPCDGGCIKEDITFKETDPLRTYCPSGDAWMEQDKTQFVKIVAMKNGCTSTPAIKEMTKKGKNDYIVLSCNDMKLVFECEFGTDCWKKCWRIE